MEPLRPWGQIDWLIEKLVDREWALIGCCGTEMRSTALAEHFGRERFVDARIVEIHDPDPEDPTATRSRLDERRTALSKSGFHAEEIRSHGLLSDIDTISSCVTELAELGAKSLIIDITSLPKYWFFPIVQTALTEERFDDVIITYTAGTGYAEHLSDSMLPIRVLPGFNSEERHMSNTSLVIGIGFDPVGLESLLSDLAADKIRLIFPFPPGPPGHRRNWMFVKHVEDLTPVDEYDVTDRVHIHMYDCPQVFDALREWTDEGRQPVAIAPYGPKTVSLAMCLYAIASVKAGRPRVPVYYAQPTRYAIDYTEEVATFREAPHTTAYLVRLNGKDLYSLAE